MSKEDDDEESNNINLSRFPCMPSLVALQQMRNRLHMAYVGKKLMKWTAQATGRELRKVAFELTKTCYRFREDMRDSYILLARARYFYPNLNNMVLEHVAKKSEITVDVKMKSITGVKIIRLELMDNNEDAYPHLGIEKGGEAIRDAKYAWKHVLKRIIHVLEQRTSFIHVDEANIAATKKKNVIEKVIIPKTKQTIKFILEEIEELEREDTYRLKMFKKLKEARLKKIAQLKCTCLSSYAAERENDESVCFVCKMRFKNAPDNKLYIEHILSHIDDMVTLTKHYKLDESVPGEMNRFVQSCDEIKGYIEKFARDPFVCNVCKIHDTALCNTTHICKTAPDFDYKERGSPKTSEEPSISNSQACQCFDNVLCDNTCPNISTAGYSNPGQEYAGPALLTNDIIKLNAPKLATCQYDESSTYVRPTKTTSDPISSSSVPSQDITSPSPLPTIGYLKELNSSQLASCQYGECDSSNQLTTGVPLSRCFYQCEVNKAAEVIQVDIHAREVSTSTSATCQYDDKSECFISCQETVQETVQLVDNYIRDFATSTCQYDNNNIPPSGYQHRCQENVEPKQIDNYIRDFTTPKEVICKCSDDDYICMQPNKMNSKPTSRYCFSNQERNMPESNDYYKDLDSSNFNFQNNIPLSVYSNPWQQRTTSINRHTNNSIIDNNSPTCRCSDRQKSEYSWQERTTPEDTQMNEYSREYHTFVFESSTTCQCSNLASSNIRQTKSSSDIITRDFSQREERATPETGPAIDYPRELNPSQSDTCQYHDKSKSSISNPWQENTTCDTVQIDYLRELNDFKSTSCQCSGSVSTNIRPNKSFSDIETRGFVPSQEITTPKTGQAVDYPRELNDSQSATCQYHDKSKSMNSNLCQESSTCTPVQIDYLKKNSDLKCTSCFYSVSVSTNMHSTQSSSDIVSSGVFPGQERATPETGPAIDYPRELNPSQSDTCQYYDKSKSTISNPWQEITTCDTVQIDYLRELNDFKSISCQCSDSVSTNMRPTKSFSDIETRGFVPSQEITTPKTGQAVGYPRELNHSQSATCQYHDKSKSMNSNLCQESSTCTPVQIDNLKKNSDLKCTSCFYSVSVSTNMHSTQSSSDIVSSGVFPGQERATPQTGPAIDYPRELNPSQSATCQYHDNSKLTNSNPWQDITTRTPVQIDYLKKNNDFKCTSCLSSVSVSTNMHSTQSFSDIVSSGVFPGQESAKPETGPAIDYPRELDPSQLHTCQYHDKLKSRNTNPWQECTTREPVQIDYLRELNDFKSSSCQCSDSVSTNLRPTKSFSDIETRDFDQSQQRTTPETDPAIKFLRELNHSKSTSCQFGGSDMHPTKPSSGVVSRGIVACQEKTIPETGQDIDYLRELNPSSATCQYHDKSVSGYSRQEKLNASKSTTCQCPDPGIKQISGSFMPYPEVTAPEVAKSKDYSSKCSSTWKSQPCDCDHPASTNFRPTKESERPKTTIFNRVGKPNGVEPCGLIGCNATALPDVAASITMNISPSTCKTRTCSKIASYKSVKEKTLGTRKTAEADNEKSLSLNVDDNSLGFFEKQTKEIVRVTRGVDEDGAMVEEKHFITIRTEKRAANKYAKFNTDITQDLKELNVECSSNKVPETRGAKSQNSNTCHVIDSPINRPCTTKNYTICRNYEDLIPKYDPIFKNSSMDAKKQTSSDKLVCKCILRPTKDSTTSMKKSYESFGCQVKFSSSNTIVSESQKTAKDSFPKTCSVNTLNCNPEECQLNQIATIKPSYDSISKKPLKATQQKDVDGSIAFKESLPQNSLQSKAPCPSKNEECTFMKDEKIFAISCKSENTSTDAVSQRSSKDTLPCKYKSCPSKNTATSIETKTNTATCMTEKCPFKTSSYFVMSSLSQNTSTYTLLEKHSGNTLQSKYKNHHFKNAATNYDVIRNITEKTSTDTLLLKSSENKLSCKHRSCQLGNMDTISSDTAALLTETTSMGKLHEQSTKHPINNLCSNCKQELIKEPEPAKDRPQANFVLVPYARTLATQTGYKEVWVDTTIMRKTSRCSAIHNCNTKASSPIWTEVETPKSNVSITCSGKSNFKSIPSIFGDTTAEYDDDQVKVIIKVIPKTQARMTCSAGTILPKPSLDKYGNLPNPQDEKPSTFSCPNQTQSCRLVKIKHPRDNCDCEKSKTDQLGSMTKSVSCKTCKFSGSTQFPASSNAFSTIGTCKSTSSQPESAKLKHNPVSDKTNSEEELFACTLQKNRSNKSSCTGTSIYSSKVISYRASTTSLRSGGSNPFTNASTLTKRSDRFDLRTLRQLRMNRKSSTHSHKMISFMSCCSDPHFNKVKAKRPLRKCHSCSDGDCYHRC